jgi:hypothetical protein
VVTSKVSLLSAVSSMMFLMGIVQVFGKDPANPQRIPCSGKETDQGLRCGRKVYPSSNGKGRGRDLKMRSERSLRSLLRG